MSTSLEIFNKIIYYVKVPKIEFWLFNLFITLVIVNSRLFKIKHLPWCITKYISQKNKLFLRKKISILILQWTPTEYNRAKSCLTSMIEQDILNNSMWPSGHMELFKAWKLNLPEFKKISNSIILNWKKNMNEKIILKVESLLLNSILVFLN